MLAPVRISSKTVAACSQCQIRSHGEYNCSRMSGILRPSSPVGQQPHPRVGPGRTTPRTIRLPSQLTQLQRSCPRTYKPEPAVEG